LEDYEKTREQLIAELNELRRRVLDIETNCVSIRKLEEALTSTAAETKKLRSMIDGMEEGVVLSDSHGIVTEVNSWFLKKAHLNRDQLLGQSIWLFHTDKELKKTPSL